MFQIGILISIFMALIPMIWRFIVLIFTNILTSGSELSSLLVREFGLILAEPT